MSIVILIHCDGVSNITVLYCLLIRITIRIDAQDCSRYNVGNNECDIELTRGENQTIPEIQTNYNGSYRTTLPSINKTNRFIHRCLLRVLIRLRRMGHWWWWRMGMHKPAVSVLYIVCSRIHHVRPSWRQRVHVHVAHQ